ncbi:type II toxin-antitoxin system Phd/YefM family antitoxin [Neomoorella thermoacetica]|uniref:type II toxin-antitoxin system Phd/YefM family antitoxin n=1 Tax=Neomoorella thermoacetica TaxID=1525 RepID=UPI0008FBB0C8|nr:type II toxin-antitoxin system prevent-host-death family antitoxin [Moorella thermoacetica]OIQ55620.1 hypothetisches protein [Moorella thermoacetica]
MLTMNVSQAKEQFLEVIRQVEDWESVVLEKKGKPVAALLPYEEYTSLCRIKNFLAMQELYAAMKDSGITAREIYQDSHRELETREEHWT